MVKQVGILTLGCAFLLFSCKPSSSGRGQKAAAHDVVISGNWVCVDALSDFTSAKSTKQVKELPPYTELVFMSDSGKLTALNGQVELVNMTYTRKDDMLKLSSDAFDNNINSIIILNDSTLLYRDGARGEEWRFVKASTSMVITDGVVHEAFPAMLNQILLSGDYTVINAEKTYSITFRNNGYIYGSPNYTRYSICYSGDCANFSEGELVYLTNGQHGDYYGWKASGDTLTVYSLRAINTPDEMPDYKFDKPILVMKKN